MRSEREFPSGESGQGVGARLPRKEDDRLMRGRGQYVADIRLAGLHDVAFVRSPLAHARIRGVHVPERHRGSVFTAADLDLGPFPIDIPFLPTNFPRSALASDTVRFVGELIVAVVAESRAEATDAAQAVIVDYEPLPSVIGVEEPNFTIGKVVDQGLPRGVAHFTGPDDRRAVDVGIVEYPLDVQVVLGGVADEEQVIDLL